MKGRMVANCAERKKSPQCLQEMLVRSKPLRDSHLEAPGTSRAGSKIWSRKWTRVFRPCSQPCRVLSLLWKDR